MLGWDVTNMALSSSANDSILLSSASETDTNLSEASELSLSTGYKITSFLNKSILQQNLLFFATTCHGL